MNNETIGAPGKNVPFSLIMPFFGLILLCTVLHGIGTKFGNHALSTGGLVGVFMSCMYAFNRCYQKGCTDGKKADSP